MAMAASMPTTISATITPALQTRQQAAYLIAVASGALLVYKLSDWGALAPGLSRSH